MRKQLSGKKYWRECRLQESYIELESPDFPDVYCTISRDGRTRFLTVLGGAGNITGFSHDNIELPVLIAMFNEALEILSLIHI